MFLQRKNIFVLSALALTLAACQPKGNSADPGESADIFGNRAIEAVPDMYVVTLKSPPILAVATKTAHGWNVPANAKQKILNEQAKFEAQLKTLAPDAKIIYRYRMTLNAIAIYSSVDVQSALAGISGVQAVNHALTFARPEALNVMEALKTGSPVNSVNFIGAERAHQLGFTGKGMRVGVIDTGIDYTHAMLGGTGKQDDYDHTDPAKTSPLFPNDKVIGGIDLVGTDFDAASPLAANHEPKIDRNPLDEAGHGSHVAGTIAGHGDGVVTYDGVAPDAKLYAIKVFGKDGSTADASVIAGFEFAADPNGDMNPDDQLDVINMSLGGGFGQPRVLYGEAVKNLSRAGTVVVASAGNSGSIDYIVGAPSTADDAISVAASIDGALVNWQFAASLLTSSGMPSLLVKAVEGPISKAIADAGDVRGELVDIGDASVDLSDAQKQALKGKIALIARGKVSFADKLARAVSGGAIGALVYTNDAKDPIPMGGEPNQVVAIPAIMVSQAVGRQMLKQMQTAPVILQFQTTQKIEEPQRIDIITDFSSKGPRSEDNLIKPEIAAPGQNITSAAMGTGHRGVKMDGTSMAAPHMTGTIALLKQAHPDLTSAELKSLVMGTSKVLSQSGTRIPITLQGSGRVQVDQAIDAPVISETASISLGRVQLLEKKTAQRKIVLRNLTDTELTLSLSVQSVPGLDISVPGALTLPAHGNTTLTAKFNFSMQDPQQLNFELDGRILFALNDKVVLQIPVMAIRSQTSTISGSLASNSITLVNASPNPGLALAFNLLGEDARKDKPDKAEKWKDSGCDLKSAGYRILRDDKGEERIQFGFKVYQPVTTWIMCSVSVLIDSDGDGIEDQEIAGVAGSGLEGLAQSVFTTVVLDSTKARGIRMAYEKQLSAGNAKATVDYTPAVLAQAGMAPFQHSTVVVIEAPLKVLKPGKDGNLHLKLAAQAEGGTTFQADNFLGGNLGIWLSLSPKFEDQPFSNLPELLAVTSTGAKLDFSKGPATSQLVIYYPLNQFTMNGKDGQEQVF